MRKAFYTLSVALAALFPLLLLSQAAFSAHSMHSRSAALALSFVAKKEAELDFKHAVSQVLSNSAGDSAEERLAATAANLAVAQLMLKREYASRGVLLEPWAGVVAPGEREEMARQMLAEGRPLACRACVGLSSPSALRGLLFYNGSATTVSRKGGAQSDAGLPPFSGAQSDEVGVVVIGASVLVGNVSGVFGVWG